MAFGTGNFLVALFLVVVFMIMKVDSIVTPTTTTTKQVPCFFVFGDSLSDNGNNNNLQTHAKANYRPYGIDFPAAVPTGRFTNNRTYIDVISQLLGFDSYIPNYNRNMGSTQASQGVNYASGGAGILYETGRQNLGDVISLNQQTKNHRRIVAKIGNQINLSKCLYNINIGNNDYINNYFKNQSYPSSRIYTPTQFATRLIAHYKTNTRILYRLGARKIAFYLLTQIGCSLGEIVAFGATGCVQTVNDAVDIFNRQLIPMINQLGQELPGAKFTYINSSAIEPSAFTGVKVFTAPCCTPRSDGQCEANSTPCSNRDEHYFWDLFHPTDVVHKVVGARAYSAKSTAEAFPYDISKLVQLQ